MSINFFLITFYLNQYLKYKLINQSLIKMQIALLPICSQQIKRTVDKKIGRYLPVPNK